MSTWANLVRGWVGYTDTTPIEGTTTELDREEIADQWLMVDDTNAPATLIDVTNEELPSPELVRRRKIWKRRMEKAKSTGQSPSPLPPRAKVLRKTGSTAPYTKKPAERTKTKRKTSVKTTPIDIKDENNEVTSDVLPSSSTSSTQVSNLDKKSYVQAAYRGHANNHCRVSNFSRFQQHKKQIQQPSKKN